MASRHFHEKPTATSEQLVAPLVVRTIGTRNGGRRKEKPAVAGRFDESPLPDSNRRLLP
jgi:hypothetical protein